MTNDDMLWKLNRLMERLIMHNKNSYHLIAVEDRMDYKKDLSFVEHAVNSKNKGNGFAKKDMIKLNKVWKKYKPKEYVSHA